MSRAPFALSCSLLAAACASPQTAPPGGEASPAGEGLLVVSDAVDLGPVAWSELPEEGLSHPLVVENRGSAALRLTAVRAGGPSFSVALGAPVVLEAGAAEVLSLTFAPEAGGGFEDALSYEVDGVVQPGASTALSAVVLAPVVSVGAVDFGAVQPGCVGAGAAEVENTGSDGAELRELSLPPGVALAEAGLLPVELGPGEVLALPLTWTVDATDLDAALVLSLEGGPEATAEAGLVGRVEALGEGATSLELPRWSEADLLVHYDCSTRPGVGAGLQEGAFELVQALADGGLSPRLAVTVQDSGCIRGDTLFVHEALAESEARAVAEAMVGLQQAYGSDCERAFTGLEATLAADAPGECNEGLLRPDALRHLVGVSDEPEQSTHDYTHYLSVFEADLDSPERLRVHAMGGDHPAGCSSSLADAGAYSGMYEATVATGGTFLSVCEPVADNLAALAEAVVETTEEIAEGARWVHLDGAGTVDPDTLAVSLDGLPLGEEEWSWSEADGAVLLLERPPEGGTVEVSWTLLPDCAGEG